MNLTPNELMDDDRALFGEDFLSDDALTDAAVKALADGNPPNGDCDLAEVITDLARALLEARAEVGRLKDQMAGLVDFVDDFATAKIDALRYSTPHGASPDDEPDPVVDAETVWAWQQDARAAIRAAKGEPK